MRLDCNCRCFVLRFHALHFDTSSSCAQMYIAHIIVLFDFVQNCRVCPHIPLNSSKIPSRRLNQNRSCTTFTPTTRASHVFLPYQVISHRNRRSLQRLTVHAVTQMSFATRFTSRWMKHFVRHNRDHDSRRTSRDLEGF